MTDPLLILLALIALLALDLIALATRSSFLQTSHARLLGMRDELGPRVNRTLLLLQAMPRLRASLNLVLVMARFGLAGLSIWFVSLRLVSYPALAAILGLLVCALVTFWLEWAIERVALRSPEILAVRLTGVARIFMALTAFLLVPLALSSEPQVVPEMSAGVIQDDLKTLVDAGEEEGLIQGEERRMIYSIFELSNTAAREIMIPRIDILSLDVQTSIGEAIDALLGAGYSRVPVYEDSVDNTLGLLYAKDLLRAWRMEDRGSDLHNLLRPAHFIPESKKLDELLAEMQSRRIHMAIVVDEYGGVAGVVTLEDIVEEFLGEIRDEYDTGEEAPYQKLPDGSFSFLGRVILNDFNEIMGSNLSSDDADTLGGYIYSQIGRVPLVGETVRAGSLLLTVEQVSVRRIRRVNARWLEESTVEKEEERVDG